MSFGASPSLKTIADLIGDIAPHSMSEMYGIIFADGSSSPASGMISLSSFRNKNLDSTAPVITLIGDATVFVPLGSTYTDPGATSDGGETVTVDTSQNPGSNGGTWTVYYSATDAAGNTGTATRTVKTEVRQPASGWQSETNSNAVLTVGVCGNAADSIRWDGGPITSITPTITFPITVGGWTYYYQSTSYDAAPAFAVCGAQGQGGYTTGATYHRIYRIGVP